MIVVWMRAWSGLVRRLVAVEGRVDAAQRLTRRLTGVRPAAFPFLASCPAPTVCAPELCPG